MIQDILELAFFKLGYTGFYLDISSYNPILFKSLNDVTDALSKKKKKQQEPTKKIKESVLDQKRMVSLSKIFLH